jgi:hypothetical protein
MRGTLKEQIEMQRLSCTKRTKVFNAILLCLLPVMGAFVILLTVMVFSLVHFHNLRDRNLLFGMSAVSTVHKFRDANRRLPGDLVEALALTSGDRTILTHVEYQQDGANFKVTIVTRFTVLRCEDVYYSNPGRWTLDDGF